MSRTTEERAALMSAGAVVSLILGCVVCPLVDAYCWRLVVVPMGAPAVSAVAFLVLRVLFTSHSGPLQRRLHEDGMHKGGKSDMSDTFWLTECTFSAVWTVFRIGVAWAVVWSGGVSA